jgi:hypothetical protein
LRGRWIKAHAFGPQLKQFESFLKVRPVQEADHLETFFRVAGVELQESVLHTADPLYATSIAARQAQRKADWAEQFFGDAARAACWLLFGAHGDHARKQGP